MSRAKVLGIRVVLFFLASVGVANLLHRVVFPADPPDPATYPRAGDRFGSAAEGVNQQVVAVRDGWVVLRTQVAPRAPGPPMHFHRSFAEIFRVESGKLHVELSDGTIQLGPGEEHRVEPGVPHRPYNPTDEEVIIASDKPAAIPSSVRLTTFLSETLDASTSTSELQKILDAASDGRYHVNLNRVFRLDEIVEAHRYMESNQATGKIVVKVSGSSTDA